MFILRFGSNSNAFYLYRAISAACSSTSRCAHGSYKKGVVILRIYPYPAQGVWSLEHPLLCTYATIEGLRLLC